MLAMTFPVRRTPQPPQPVEPDNPIWIARAWQWVFDRLSHLDECMDETKDSVKEQHIELSAWMTASSDADADVMQRIAGHIEEHNLIDRATEAKRSVWKMQSGIVRDVLKFATEGTVIAVLIGILKYLGAL